MSAKVRRHPKIVVIGGGTGLPVTLKSFRNKGADITAIVTVADDGGSSGEIRDQINISPPGDLRNVLVALSDISPLSEEIFQYRFKQNDGFISNHTIGNLVIAALSEMSGSTNRAIELLAEEMNIDGKVIPASEKPLVLHAVFKDGTTVSGESKIAEHRKMIDYVYVTNVEDSEIPHASPQVIEEILDADMVVLGPGSLYTSILPNLMIPEINEAIRETSGEVVYICNIMTQKGETEHFTDADHIRVLHHHVKSKFIDTVLVNTEIVPSEFPNKEKYDEVLDQVVHDFKGLRNEECRVISADFLKLRDGGVFHDGDKVVSELFNLVFGAKF